MNIVCGFPYFFSSNVIKNSKNPIINCHGGNLPNYRGGSPLSWQIINNEKNIFISTLLIAKGTDDGKILLKKKFRLKKNMNILDVQNKANSIFPKLVIQSIDLILNKKKLKRQIGKIKVYKQRNPADSFFVPKKTKYLELKNLHRATFPLYCPPFFLDNNNLIFIEKFKLTNKNKENKNFQNKFYLKLKDLNIVISKYKKKFYINQNKKMNIISKLMSYIFAKLLPFVDRMTYLRYFNQPFSNSPKSNKENYYKLFKKAEINTYSVKDVDLLEKEYDYSINRDWLNSLALETQIVIKKSELNYAHGRVLYTILRNYLSTLKQDIKKINIIETGTARGFSAMCMAKALSDSEFEGSICTLDVLPHYKRMFWNCISDHSKGSQTRHDLLGDWADLSERYIIFFSRIYQTYTK